MNEKNRKAILDHIDKIEQYAKTDPWLMSELRRRFGGGNDEPILRVEKYLGLDYALDSAESMIDYSYVTDKYIRNQLESDFREMLRYRYGVRSHKIDFDEFCRYAHLQAEALVNYYYNTSCGDFYSAKNKILRYNPGAKISDEYQQIESINYAVKIWAFFKEYCPPPRDKKQWFSDAGQTTYDTLNYVKYVRNKQSHRGTQSEYINFINNYKKKAEELGMPWNKTYDNFDWEKLNNNYEYSRIYDDQFKKGNEQYKFCVWYLKNNYEGIIKALRHLSLLVQTALVQTEYHS